MPKRNAQIAFTKTGFPSKPGEAKWYTLVGENDVSGLHYGCPCGCGAMHGIRFKKPGIVGWEWDGNRKAPTCTPSLGMYPMDGQATDGSGYHWHGHLTAGVFVEC